MYKNKRRLQFLLFVAAVLIGLASLFYTNRLVKNMARQEQLKAGMLANAWSQIINAAAEDTHLDFYAGVIEDNETIPVIVTDSQNQIIMTRNLDSKRVNNPKYLQKQLQRMKENAEPVIIPLPPSDRQYLYFNKSILLTRLQYYPYVQIGIVLLFILVAYLAFNTSRKFEQNQLWVGLSKETAHQLGTPISSLMAWLEMMKMKNGDLEMVSELEKDVTRLEKITERFSKIGSKPDLIPQDIVPVIQAAIHYIKSRSSDKVKFTLNLPSDKLIVPLNAALFEWVIENLCKNAIDAIQGSGSIEINLSATTQNITLDIADTGKGIPKSMFSDIFKPGYTTKKKGWGLGLSLVKRIIEEYHEGKIFVSQSELNKGTVFRIILNRL